MTGLSKADVVKVLQEHTIECTGLGEVTCRGCRGDGWMAWPQYRSHVANLIVALPVAAPSGFCRKMRNCRLADGHADGCRP